MDNTQRLYLSCHGKKYKQGGLSLPEIKNIAKLRGISTNLNRYQMLELLCLQDNLMKCTTIKRSILNNYAKNLNINSSLSTPELCRSIIDKLYPENNATRRKYLALSLVNKLYPKTGIPYINHRILDEEGILNISNFYASVNVGHVAKVQKYLDAGFDPSIDNNNALIFAISSNKPDIINLLLTDQRVDPSTDNNTLFLYACKNNHITMIKRLLHDHRVNPADRENEAFIKACQYNHIDVVKVLLTEPRIDPTDQNNLALLSTLSNNESIEITKLLLTDKRIVPTIAMLQEACDYNNLEAVKLLMYLDLNITLLYACQNNYVQLATEIMTDGMPCMTDGMPCMTDERLLETACVQGHIKIVKLLLSDPRTKASDDILITAITSGNSKIVKLLLNDERINTDDDNFLYVACNQDNYDMVKMLILARPSKYDNTCLNKALEISILHNNEKIVKLLLTHIKDQLSQNALQLACEYGLTDILLILLKDGRSDPSYNGSNSLKLAVIGSHTNVVKILLNTGKVDVQVGIKQFKSMHYRNQRIQQLLTSYTASVD